MCKWFIRLLVVAYVVALALFIIGTFGLFGQPSDPLSGLYLIPIGLPWNMAIDITPEPLWPWLAAAAPILNILLIRWLCRRFAPAPS